MKLSFKINLLFTVIVTGILLGMTILMFNLSRSNVHQDFRQRLKTRAARAAFLYSLFRNDTTNLLKSLDANTPPTLVNKSITIYNPDYTVLYEFHDVNVGELQADTTWLFNGKKNGEYFFSRNEKEIYVYYSDNNNFPVIVMVAAENIAGKEYISNLKKIFIFYFPVAVLVTLIAGYLFSRTIIQPVRETISDVKLITSQNLSHRLYTGKRKDELAELNETFNDLLNRLEESFAMEKRFISNASHELSTPLTSISSQIQVALLQDRTTAEYQQVLASVLKDVQGLHFLTRNLLEIAKAGTHGAISLEKVRLDEILIKAHSEVLRQNDGYKIELAFPEFPEDENECLVFGNIHLLHSAFKNIMENGCKYSPDKKTSIRLQFKGNESEIIFSNKSGFISSEEIERFFEPFYRGSNSESKPGVGLGLTLARRIIGLHKGSLVIQSVYDMGTIITVLLPTLKK
ncbi:MAG: HAMP domain-containing protein [Chitinophagaceae bacterium]|nr:HAMP domain-containing protein [Chitinophagaceae bacterium]MBK9937099.1 HAMP domain-containing protein [Chitinophagaceae bacterium]